MKTTIVATVVSLCALLYACSPGNCTCKRAVYSYAGGQIIFYPPSTDSIATRDKDSLTAIYGPEKDSVVSVSVLHNSATWATYQNQGYSCGCAK